uniref:Putative ovule protein n=1 Tax=Solanum chacoense TaxID=4108 RepID=A0A0V0ITA3_SOLCH
MTPIKNKLENVHHFNSFRSSLLECWSSLTIFIVVLDWKCLKDKESSCDNYNEFFKASRRCKFIWTRQVPLFAIPLLSDSTMTLPFIWVSACGLESFSWNFLCLICSMRPERISCLTKEG